MSDIDHSKPFPEMDRVVAHVILGGDKPVAATNEQWNQIVQGRPVSHSKRVQSFLRMQHYRNPVERLPKEVTDNSDDFVMLRIDRSNPHVAKMAEAIKDTENLLYRDAGIRIDEELSGRYSLSKEDDFAVYHVNTARGMGSAEKRMQLFETGSTQSDAYLFVVRKSVYQALAMRTIARMGRGESAQHTANKIVDNAALTAGQIGKLVDMVSEEEEYELAASLRDMARKRSGGASHRARLGKEKGDEGRNGGAIR